MPLSVARSPAAYLVDSWVVCEVNLYANYSRATQYVPCFLAFKGVGKSNYYDTILCFGLSGLTRDPISTVVFPHVSSRSRPLVLGPVVMSHPSLDQSELSTHGVGKSWWGPSRRPKPSGCNDSGASGLSLTPPCPGGSLLWLL